MISSTSFLITAFTAFSRLLGYSHSWHHPRAIRRGPTTTFLAFPQSWEVILFLLKASSIIFRYMLADPQCIYLQYTLLRPLWMPPGDCSACSSFIENIPSSQTFIRTQGGYTICTKHSSKFCPQEVIAFDMSKVSVCCLICRLSIFDDHYFYYWPLKIFIYLFGWAGSSLLSTGPSSCSERGLLSNWGAQASHCGGLSCCRAWALGIWASVVVVCGLSCCGSQDPEHRLSNLCTQAQLLCNMWNPPGPQVEPTSPALAGGLSATGPPGKPVIIDLLVFVLDIKSPIVF